MCMTSNYTRLFWALLFGGCLAMSCQKNNSSPSPAKTQPDSTYFGRQAFIVSINSSFILYDTVLSLIGGGILDTLAQPGPYTSFIPDNNALIAASWGYASNGIINYVQAPSNARTTVLSLIVRGTQSLRALPVGRNQVFLSLKGTPLFVSKYVIQSDTLYAVNGIPVSTPDFPATNGPIEILDKQVPNIVSYATISAYVNSAPELTYLALALQRSGLDKLLASDTLTLLAPCNAAFQSSPDPSLNSIDSLLTADTAKLARVLRYHIIQGRNFLYDFTLQATGTDTLRVPTLLNGETVSLFFKDMNGNPGNYFLGPGNFGLNPYSGVTGPLPVGLFSPGSGQFTADQPVGNGVVHELGGLLIP
jgi:uncharacterized surface protein with fasciclin (FAS1) repeats